MNGARMDPFRTQLITVAIDTFQHRRNTDLIPAALQAVDGVEVVEPDPATGRVWVFANGEVDPESLVDVLASWGYDACILENQFELAA
jgi:copper chaperone CopZ